MGHAVPACGTRRIHGSALLGIVGASGAALFALTGHHAIAMAVGGGVLTWGSLAAGRIVFQWFDRPHQEGMELWWNLVLVCLVLGGLAGLWLMALALPT